MVSKQLLKAKLLSDLEALVYAKCEKNFGFYFKQAWKVLEPATPLLSGWHHDLIAEYLQAAWLGQIKRLIINMPPRYGKSNLVTVAFPTWAWITKPEMRFLFTSYSGSLSNKHSVDRRSLIESNWYQNAWNDRFAMSTDQNVKTEFQNDKRGHMIAASMSGTATGKGGNFLIVDDPHDTTRAFSDVKRESDLREFDQKFTTRLDDKKQGVIVIVMQRLHQADLSGHLLAQGGYEHLCLPAEMPERKVFSFPLSFQSVVKEAGEVLHPEREGLEELEKVKKALGSQGYAGQYLQTPSAQEGAILKRSWFKFYKVLPELDTQIQSWDLGFKETKSSDYVVGQCWGRKGADKYLIDQVRGRFDFPATLWSIRTFTAKHAKAQLKLIEDKANGPAVIATLKTEIPGIVAVDPKTSKEARVHSISPQIEAGNVWLPDPSVAPWIHDFIEECCVFPNGMNDDQVDAMTQALDRLSMKAQPKAWVI